MVKKVANMIQALYSKYLELKSKNLKLSDRNLDLENRVDRLREEVSVIKKENVALLNVAYDMDRGSYMFGKIKVKDAIEVAKHLEQANCKATLLEVNLMDYEMEELVPIVGKLAGNIQHMKVHP